MIARCAATVSFALATVAAACGGSVAVGRTNESTDALQTTTSGQPTGNGTTCTWAGTALLAADPTADVPATYAVGASFESLDGCNSCSCTAKGIACTKRTCTPTACPADAKVCPDGTTVSRTGPDCSFPACPVAPDSGAPPVDTDAGGGAADASPPACPVLAKECPDGGYVEATGPDCSFPACP